MRLVTLCIVMLVGMSCASRNASHFGTGTVSHVVVCYLKKPGDPGDRARVIQASKDLRRIPGVVSIEVGKVLGSNRPIVVSNYDVALVVTFRDREAMEGYVNHPVHVEAVEKVLKPLTSKVVVYDFVNE